jgi:serine/threonine protein kinase
MWASSFQVRSSNRTWNRSHSENSNKYMITCQDRIAIESPTTNEWLSIIGPLKKTNQRDLNRVLEGIIERQTAAAIKISASQLLAKEYAIASILKDIPGFMQPYCFFQCDDDYKEHPSKERSALCIDRDTSMSILVMPYLEGGSMREFNWASNPAALHSCLMQFFCSLNASI